MQEHSGTLRLKHAESKKKVGTIDVSKVGLIARGIS